MAGSLAKTRTARNKSSPVFQMGKLPPVDVEGTRDTVLRLSGSEIYWLVFGRTEFRLSYAFLSQAIHMAPGFQVKALLQKEKRRVARLTWPKGALCCGLVCAYLEITDISIMEEVNRAAAIEIYGPHEVQISITECDGVNPILFPPRPRNVFVGDLDEPLITILARRAIGPFLASQLPIPEPVLDALDQIYEDHDSDIQHSLPLAAVGTLAFLLFDQNHRFVQKVNSLVTTKRRGEPCDPVPYLIGSGLSVLPKDRDLVNVGAVEWEQFEGEDGQVLFHWPTPIEDQVEAGQEPADIPDIDGG